MYDFALVEQEEQLPGSSCVPNEFLLSLFHSSLEHELNDREIPLANSDHSAFMHHILQRERYGHVAPFSLHVNKGKHTSLNMTGAVLTTHPTILKVQICSNRAGSDSMLHLISLFFMFCQSL